MIKFKTLKMTNFMSYGAVPTIIQLDHPGTCLLLGEDLDNTASGSGSNGVGKTTIINALVYALYDRSLPGAKGSEEISKDGLVNHTNKNKMEVTIEFERDGVNYLIVRNRKMKAGAAGNTTALYENGIDITLGQNVNETNAEIEKILGVSYDIFCRIVTFSINQVPFLNLPVRHPTQTNQTDFIEELLELKILSEKAELLKDEIKDTEGSLKTHLEKVEAIKAEHERHNKQVESAKKRVVTWEQNNATEIEDIKHRIEKLQGINVDEQAELFKLDNELLTARVVEESNIRKKTEELKPVKQKIHNLEIEMGHLYKGECPRCHQKFQESHEHMAEMDLELSQLKDQKPILEQELTEFTKKYNEITREEQANRKKLQVKSLIELHDTKNKIENLQDKLQELHSTANPHTEVLDELCGVTLEQIDMTRINELKNLLDHQQFLLKLLTKKDSFVRKALVNKHIPFLNGRLKKYLIDLGLPHVVEFTHEMTAKISRFGNDMEFGNLSNGQRARVNLALSFAFRDVLQSMHQFVNICMLDEVLDFGLDAVGVQAAAKMLKRKARDEKIGLFIISHRDEIDSAFDRKMIVQMSNGFSSIRYEDG